MTPEQRPPKPMPDDWPVWYRGWEADYNHDAATWTGEGWYACRGGADLGCQMVAAATWELLLDAIDEEED